MQLQSMARFCGYDRVKPILAQRRRSLRASQFGCKVDWRLILFLHHKWQRLFHHKKFQCREFSYYALNTKKATEALNCCGKIK